MASEVAANNPTRWIAPVLVWVVIASLVILLGSAWMFFMTQNVTIMLVGMPFVLLPVYLLLLYLVWRDANEQGMMGALWVIVVAFLFVFGLAVYLVVREFKTLRQTA